MSISSLYHKAIDSVSDVIRNIDANGTLTVHGLNESNPDAIFINNPFYEKGLYAIELSTSSNIANFIPKSHIQELHSKFKYAKDGFLYWILLKKESYQKNYIFSYNKSIIDYIGSYYNRKPLNNLELLNILFDLQLDNDYIVDPIKKEIFRNLDLTKDFNFEFINYKFNQLIKDTVYENLHDTNVYQATHYKTTNQPTNITKLFNVDFIGAVYTYVSFNKNTATKTVQNWLDSANQSMSGEKPKLEIIRDQIKDNEQDVVSLNTTLIIKKSTDSIQNNSNIASCLNVSLKKDKEGRSARKDIIKFSPLIKKNEMWTKPIPIDFLDNYICSVHKEYSKNPQIHGYDLNKAHTNYNIRYANKTDYLQKAHFFIGGKTGSTKTTFVNTMISQMLDFDWTTNKIQNPTAVKIRQFDIKKSLKPHAQFINQTNPGTVSIMETDLNEFSYNLININQDENGELDQNDLAFCKATTSFIISAKDKSPDAPLSFDEDTLFGRLIEEVYQEDAQEKLTIEEVGYYQPNLVKELYALGYSKRTYLHEIKEKEYTFLKKPTIQNVATKLNNLVNDSKINQDPTQLITVQSLRKKIRTISELGEQKIDGKKIPGYFSRYERMSVDYEKQWLLFDMDKIKSSPEYAPIQWILLNKIAHEDMKGQLRLREQGLPEPQILYFIEEAHNMFDNPLFRSTEDQKGILDTQAKEWRSYGMFLAPISQEIEHIPKEVLNAMESFFLLFPSKSDDMDLVEAQLKDIERILSLEKNERVMQLLRDTPPFHACTLNSMGAFIIGLPTTEKMRLVFDGKYKLNKD